MPLCICNADTGTGCVCHAAHTNSCPAHPQYVPAITPTTWTDNPVDTNTQIKAQHFNELRTSISNEITRRGTGPWSSDPGAVVALNLTYKPAQTTYRAIRDGINQAKTWSPYPSELLDGALTTGQDNLITSTNTMRTKVNEYEAQCACDCAYVCTCVCNYCTCVCNHLCECDCNYISDERLKKEISYMKNDSATEIIKKLKPVTFKYKDDPKEKNNFGLIAQDINKVINEKTNSVVISNLNGYYSVQYHQFISILIKAFQENNTRMEKLENDVQKILSVIERK